MFGSVQFAFAAEKPSIAEMLSKYNGDKSCYIAYTANFSGGYAGLCAFASNYSGRMCAFRTDNSTGIYSDNSFNITWIDENFKVRNLGQFNVNSSGYAQYSNSGLTLEYVEFQSTIITFGTKEDALNYIQTGEVNNPIYDNRPVKYDPGIEIPLMAQCQVNGDKFLFNCKQSEPHDDYKLQISTSVSLTPIYSNLTSKQYADTQQIYTSSKSEIGKYDNFDTAFNVSFSSTDLLNGLDTSRSALGFKEFYNGYNILLPYKESVLSKIYFYARNVSGIKCSNWVKVTYDLIAETSTYEEVESVAGSDVPSDTKKDSSESYPDDYIYNDNEPAQDSNSSGIIGYIKSGLGLVGNNSIIALIGNTFSFLPKELTTLLLFGGALLVAVGIIKVVTR